nr:hypothetical protein Itr_chr01CG22040 [Ipomoea trifida]GMC55163.1 hypothetical protein Iba_chr01eCG4860 [Ipomoea batatas]
MRDWCRDKWKVVAMKSRLNERGTHLTRSHSAAQLNTQWTKLGQRAAVCGCDTWGVR